MNAAPSLSMVAFKGDDMANAQEMAQHLGYGDNTVYTSSSALWGLYCLANGPDEHAGCIIKTKELGFLYVQDLEDIGMYEMFERLTLTMKNDRLPRAPLGTSAPASRRSRTALSAVSPPPAEDAATIAGATQARDRLHAAELAVDAFSDATRGFNEPPQDMLTDLLANLRHWAQERGLNFGDAVRVSLDHYNNEK